MTTTTEATEALTSVIRAINGGSSEATAALAESVANEHPTLSGQLGKAIAIGLVRRATYNPDWRPFDPWERDCPLTSPLGTSEHPKHPEHDGRHSCALIAGAVLMAQQWYV